MTSAPQPATPMSADEAIVSRRSIRAFLPREVPRDTVTDILRVASRAPSGSNTQPWRVYVVSGATRTRLETALLAAFDAPGQPAVQGTPEYDYYPTRWVEPYLARRRKVGWDLYGLLGLTREDKAGMAAQHRKNLTFFGAPVGLLFTVGKVMSQGSWLDYGMFLQNIMLAARARGLDTCPQAAFVDYAGIIRSTLPIPDDEAFVCGMALGWADPDSIEHSLVTERAAVAEFVRFMD